MGETRSGFTLVETVIYMSLLSVFSLLFFLTLPVRGNEDVETLNRLAEREGLILNRLHQGITNTSRDLITGWNGRGLLFASALAGKERRLEFGSEGTLKWQRWELFVHKQTSLLYQDYPFEDDQPLQIADGLASRLGQESTLVRGVTLFQIERVENHWSITLEMETDGVTFRMSTTATPRNSGL